MATHKHQTEREARPAQREGAPGAEEAPRQPPISEAATEETPVLWRKKEPSATASAAEAEADAATTVATPEGEWEDRVRTEEAPSVDYLAKWQRATADMANMRRRHDLERQEYIRQANATLIADLLPVLDSFDRALDSVPEELREQTWIDGILRVERQLRAVLERAGLTPIEAAGKPFDPTEHEALMHETSEQPEDTVTGELQRGYKLYDRVLRPAMVKVAKN